MGALALAFGRINNFIGETIKYFIPHKWLKAKEPFYKVDNEYVVYGVGGYVLGALNRLGSRFLFPGLKEIKRVQGGIIEQEFKEQASTRDNIYTNLHGTINFEVNGPKGAIYFYQSDANMKAATDIVAKYIASEVGGYKEDGIEENLPQITKNVLREFKEDKDQECELAKYGLKVNNISLNAEFDPEATKQRMAYTKLQAEQAIIEAQGEAAKETARSYTTTKTLDNYMTAAKEFIQNCYNKTADTLNEVPNIGEKVYQTAIHLFNIDNYQTMSGNPGTMIYAGSGQMPGIFPYQKGNLETKIGN